MHLTLMFLQLAVIVLVARLVGLAMRRWGQPQVVGEILTGIALGPSLFGWLLPTWQHQLFPAATVDLLKGLSSIGLVLFMFLVGLELDVAQIRKMRHKALSISLGGLVLPLVLGVFAGVVLLDTPGFFPNNSNPWVGVLFLGVAMSVTAFPVLARILSEFRMTCSRLGGLALASAAMDDAFAWMLLAGVLVLARGSTSGVLQMTVGLVVLLVFSFGVLKPLLAKWMQHLEGKGKQVYGLPVVLVLLFLYAALTEALGLHFVLGAFVLGVVTPRGWMVKEWEEKMVPLTTHLLLPVFFVVSGLNTQMQLIQGWHSWLAAAGIVVLACAGKLLGCGYAAWRSGETPAQALSVAGLMNARGLMELVVLNVGLQMGLIGPVLFSIMVLMAVVTTLMATPIFRLGLHLSRQEIGKVPARSAQSV